VERSAGLFPAVYVAREDGEFRVLGYAGNLTKIGELVLELLEGGKITIAQWWLDTIIADLHSGSGFGGGGRSTRLLWSGVKPETRGPDAVRMSAASLIGRDSPSQKAIQILQEARARSMDRVERSQIDLALCESLEKAEQWKELVAVARRLAENPLFAEDGFRFIVKAAKALKQWEVIKTEARTRLKGTYDSAAQRAMATALAGAGDREGAAAYLSRLSASSFGDTEDKLFEAWLRMLIGKADEELLQSLSKAGESGTKRAASYWYTLGMLQVTLNKPEEAQRSLTQALDHDDFAALDARPWALAGKIYEAYGLADAAAASYERARTSPQPDEMARWAISLVGR
jgi:tetratricopeptide (TPR) repeat protein